MKRVFRFLVITAVFYLLIGYSTTPLSRSASQAGHVAGFHVSGRYLLDANGSNFIMRGISLGYVWYPSQTNAFADIKKAGANTVRVSLSGGHWGRDGVQDVRRVVQLCRNNRLVCVLEDHDTTGYGQDQAAYTLAQAVSYWQEVRSALVGQEPYVIVNIGNEPWGNEDSSAWTEATTTAILAMRATGFHHTLMIDAPDWGQDWQFVMRDHAAAILQADPEHNILFSIHMYGVFDDPTKVESYVSFFVQRGLPLVIGEFGDRAPDGNPDEDAIMATAQRDGIGYAAWSWSGNTNGVEYLDLVTRFDPSLRTAWGTRLIAGANGLQQTSRQASIYRNAQATRILPPAGSPTSTPTMAP